MTSRKRRAESISSLSPISSGSESEDVESRVYLQQDEILKPTSTGLEEDEYPIYLLEDATVYSLDGENIENLLEVDVRGRVQVRGRLTISADDSEISHCKSTGATYVNIPLTTAQCVARSTMASGSHLQARHSP